MKKVILLIALVSLFSCENESGNSGSLIADGFDRTTLLNSVVENNILPAYNDFDAQLEILNTDILAFTNNANETTLLSLQNSHLNAYKVWQHVQMFNVLLASTTGYKEDFNTYPTDHSEIDNIIDGSIGQDISEINFSATSKNDAQGFPAIDYLINGKESSVVINNFSTGDFSNQYKDLLKFYIDRMIVLTDAVIEDWDTNKAVFISDKTNSLTSSFNLFINDYIFFIEKGFREAKIAFPSGVRENVNPNSERIESYYSAENSKVLFEEAYVAIQNIFTGKPYDTENTSVIGFKDYLNFLNAEVFLNNQNVQLSNYIEKTLFLNIDTEVSQLNNNFATQINTDNSKMEDTFIAIQEMVVALKVNALESFSVDVDFVDSDGD